MKYTPLIIALGALLLLAACVPQATNNQTTNQTPNQTVSAATYSCTDEPDVGLCRAYFPKYYFDGEQCQEFIWGGCGGLVPFDTLEACQQNCQEQDPLVQAHYPDRIVYRQDANQGLDVFQQHCDERGGTFNECGYPCSPTAEICIAACALTCDLSTFGQHVRDLAINRSGGLIPIEGYDADLLMGALPAIQPNDFQGVQTFEGIYHVSDNTITFERTREQPISTAERTISDAGYETLLANLKQRLGVTSEEEVLEVLRTT